MGGARDVELAELAELANSPQQNTNVCLVRDPCFRTGFGTFQQLATHEAAGSCEAILYVMSSASLKHLGLNLIHGDVSFVEISVKDSLWLTDWAFTRKCPVIAVPSNLEAKRMPP